MDKASKKKSEHHFIEAALQNFEVVADAFTDNSAIAAIPVIGTAVKICRGLDDFRSMAFAAKLLKFIAEPKLRTEAAAQKIREKIVENPDEAARVGESLFLVLDRLIDLDKPAILAKCYLAYLNGIVSVEDLQRLGQAIDHAFAADLHAFLGGELDEHEDRRPWMMNLVPSGLTFSTVRPMPPVKTQYSATPLGRLLWSSLRQAPE